MAPGTTTCDTCASEGKRCRFTDHFSGKQIRANELQMAQEKLAAALEELERYKAASTSSVFADNPLSGITGYGPCDPSRARQNWARMVRGIEPLPPQSRSNSPNSQASKRKC